MTTALITGIAGQDGVYLARHLTSLGHRVLGTVRAIDSHPAFVEAYLPHADLHAVDLTDESGMRALLEAERPDQIYNLASLSSVGASWKAPLDVARTNGLGFLVLLESVRAIREHDGYSPRICQASSAEIFGSPKTLPLDESTPLDPTNPYAVAKAFAHSTARNYREAYDMFVATVILFNHESPLRPPTFVTRKITSAAVEIAAGERELLELGRMDIRRDWGSAPDFVEAMYLTLQADRADEYCIATGRSHSLGEFVELAFEAAGVTDGLERVRTNQAFVRPNDIPELRGSPDRARRTLGWVPQTTLRQVVARMVEADSRRQTGGPEHHPDYL